MSNIDLPIYNIPDAAEISGVDVLALRSWLERGNINWGMVHPDAYSRRRFCTLDLLRLRLTAFLAKHFFVVPSRGANLADIIANDCRDLFEAPDASVEFLIRYEGGLQGMNQTHGPYRAHADEDHLDAYEWQRTKGHRQVTKLRIGEIVASLLADIEIWERNNTPTGDKLP